MNEIELEKNPKISDLIYEIREKQVMFDRKDLGTKCFTINKINNESWQNELLNEISNN